MTGALLGTTAGVHRLQEGRIEALGLESERISAIWAGTGPRDRPVILAGSYGNGLFRSDDGGSTWTPITEGLDATAFRTIDDDPVTAGAVLCGTEPGRIYRSLDGGRSWRELEAIQALPGVDEWYLPYSPRAGAVRNIYSPGGSRRLLAAVEVGGLLDSPDGGATWSCGRILTDPDIHHITGHPGDANLLFASLGWAAMKRDQRTPDSPPLGGVARSRDGGQTWTKFHTDYTRATIVPPTRPDLVLAGPAKQVGAEGRIEVSADGGETWAPAGDGIEQPMTDMVELFLAAPDGAIWAVCAGGRLFRAEAGEWRWHPVLPDQARLDVKSVAFLPAA